MKVYKVYWNNPKKIVGSGTSIVIAVSLSRAAMVAKESLPAVREVKKIEQVSEDREHVYIQPGAI